MRAFRPVVVLVGIAWIALSGPAEAQAPPPPGQAAEEIVVLVQLPVAVTRAAAAGVPHDELRDIVRQLRQADVPPAEAVDLIRFATVMEAGRTGRPEGPQAPGAPDAPGLRLSDLIRDRLTVGVSGTDLADEIHAELLRRGVPVAAQRRGPRPLSPDFVPQEGRRPDDRGPPGRVPGETGPPGERAPPVQPGPPPETGPPGRPDRPGTPGGQRPDGAGQPTPDGRF
jgi:hypothetical protein